MSLVRRGGADHSEASALVRPSDRNSPHALRRRGLHSDDRRCGLLSVERARGRLWITGAEANLAAIAGELTQSDKHRHDAVLTFSAALRSVIAMSDIGGATVIVPMMAEAVTHRDLDRDGEGTL